MVKKNATNPFTLINNLTALSLLQKNYAATFSE